jgi:glycosidase
MTPPARPPSRTRIPTRSSLLPRRAGRAVRFTYNGAPGTTSVALAGTFNSWVGDELPLARIGPLTWQVDLALEPGRHHYKYVIDGRAWIADPANGWVSEDGQNNSCLTVYESGEVFVRDGAATRQAPGRLYRERAALASPAWLKDAVVYQLSVRAFGGTFKGMRARLAYLQDLGINTVWMMPVHPIGLLRRSGALGDPYAVRDFSAVDPALGEEHELHALIGDMQQRGMRVIYDWTLNRASCDNVLTVSHPHWFTHDAAGSIAYAVPGRDSFAGFDFGQHALRAWLIAAMQRWIKRFGFDGLRFDDADITPRDFLEQIRAALLPVRPQLALIAHSCDELHHLAACDLTGDGALRDCIARIAAGSATVAELQAQWEESTYTFPRGALRLRWLEEKEQGRALAFFGAKPYFCPSPHIAAAAVLLTMDGVPHIMMGQEFCEPGWRDWRSLFDEFALDWSGYDAATCAHYRQLIALRAAHRALREGALDFIDSGSPGMLAYWRSCASERVLVVVSLTARGGLPPAELDGLRIIASDHADSSGLCGFGYLVAA